MTNYYTELGINPSLSVEDIRKILNQLESTWVRREATNPEKAVKMRSLIIEARKVFEDVASKSRYDLELEAEKQPIKENAPQDAREASLKSWNDQALTYFNNKEYDLAKTAIERAFSYVNPDVCNDALYSLAADIYYHNNNLQEALNYINKAIVEKRAPMHFILKAVICESLAKRPNNTGGNFTAECYKALDSAIAVAEENGNKAELGNAYGVYALLLQRNGCSDENRLEEYARKGMQYGDSWGNAGKVLRSIESARAQREAREKRKIEEEKQRQKEEERLLLERKQREERRKKADSERLKILKARGRIYYFAWAIYCVVVPAIFFDAYVTPKLYSFLLSGATFFLNFMNTYSAVHGDGWVGYSSGWVYGITLGIGLLVGCTGFLMYLSFAPLITMVCVMLCVLIGAKVGKALNQYSDFKVE